MLIRVKYRNKGDVYIVNSDSGELTIKQLEEKIGYTFKNKKFILTAITHKSYAFEKNKEGLDEYNERIEFLGDAVLEHSISLILYNYSPRIKEGDMSKKRAQIVCEDTLSSVIREHGIEKYLRLGRCETKSGGIGKKAMQADMFEAILGAIYLDAGFDVANEICLRLLDSSISKAINDTAKNIDYKTILQESVQAKGNAKIEYRTVREEGLAHDKIFYVEVYINGVKQGEGNGKTKKAAEKESARKAIEKV